MEKKFEDSLKKLDSIVNKLEDGDLSLDESLNLFEEGVKLFRFLGKKLDQAERKVEILLKDEEGFLKPCPFTEEES